ncbi:MFS transporter [Polymorphum gilvum]|uniref:Transporter, major facilitator family n=1 Tax=Polymorphum gilvum (strain LMG 25793 / CGMCC 1.9160 / SL003B-26A1) TaxID=991905 RepID=F2J0J2_POLGS|nr:MFS transporter [Polymorphum gilvum]ADZ69661.1 Transporter, major facilitator family [Polymorphum gilvum SL003B-26A1]
MSAPAPHAAAPPTRCALARHGAMALPLAFAGLPVYLHAPDFYATTLGLPLAGLGVVLLALRAVDALQDPLIGALGDRFDRRRPAILVAGAALLGGGLWLLFHPRTEAPLAWFALAVFVCTTGFSVVSINLQALGGLWRVDMRQRTRIAGWREGLGLVGLLLAALAPTLLDTGGGKVEAFHRLTLVYLPVLAFATALLLRWLATAPLDRPAPGGPALSWPSLLGDPWRRHFFAVYLMNTVASAIPAVLVLFFIRDRIQAEHLTGLFLLAYFLSGAASMPLWQVVAARLGKLGAWAASMALAVATFVWAALLGPGDTAAYAAVCLLSGLALGADLALPPAILADHIAATRGQAVAGRLHAVLAFVSKAALALATGLALPALGLAGYQPGAAVDSSSGLALALAYAALPCALKVATLALLLARLERLAVHHRPAGEAATP